VDWFRQGHIWWASIFVTLNLQSSVVTCVLRTYHFKRWNGKALAICFIGLGPCTAIPYILDGRIRGDAKSEEENLKAFWLLKYIVSLNLDHVSY